jgi:cleavage and polyadenylation specificity factor subunit 6/7
LQWTTDQDLTEAITDLGVTDLIDIKFYENRINGQSKGLVSIWSFNNLLVPNVCNCKSFARCGCCNVQCRFATVVLGSDASMRILYEKMQKKEIHGQNPVVMPYTKQSLAQLDGSNSADGPRNGEFTQKLFIYYKRNIFEYFDTVFWPINILTV